MGRRILYVFIAVFMFGNATLAQNASGRLDSALKLLPSAKEDTIKAKLLNRISASYFETDPGKGIEYGEQALKLSTKLKYLSGIANANSSIARCNAIQNKYTEALKYYQDGLIVAYEINNPDVIGEFLISMAAVYSGKGEQDKSLDYLGQAKTVYEKAGLPYATSLINNFGTTYSRMRNYEEALHWYLLGIKMEEEKEEKTADLERLYTNVGGLYVEKKDYSNGLKYLFNALALNLKKGANKSAAFTYYNIGSTYLQAVEAQQPGQADSLLNKKRNLERADYYTHKSLEIARALKLQNVLEVAYHDISHLYDLQGNYQKSLKYYKIYKDVHDSLRNFDEEKAFARVEAKYIFQKKTDSLKNLNALKDEELHQKKLERNGGILVISLAGIISILLINRQKSRHKQKRELAEKEVAYTRDLAQRQLDAFTQSIQEKNALIEKFADELERYKALPCSNELPGREQSQNELLNSVILTEDQWADFQILFDQVHAGYISRVHEKFQGLTAAELRFVLLTRLGLNNKEMAAMLGVGFEAIRVAKHRLLKKIQLPEGQLLEEATLSI